MQLQKVNNTNPQPNFQARNLSRVVSTAKNGVKSVIDVYSVDKKDEAFLNRFAEALKGQHLPQDSLMIGGKNAKASVLDAIKNILFCAEIIMQHRVGHAGSFCDGCRCGSGKSFCLKFFFCGF